MATPDHNLTEPDDYVLVTSLKDERAVGHGNLASLAQPVPEAEPALVTSLTDEKITVQAFISPLSHTVPELEPVRAVCYPHKEQTVIALQALGHIVPDEELNHLLSSYDNASAIVLHILQKQQQQLLTQEPVYNQQGNPKEVENEKRQRELDHLEKLQPEKVDIQRKLQPAEELQGQPQQQQHQFEVQQPNQNTEQTQSLLYRETIPLPPLPPLSSLAQSQEAIAPPAPRFIPYNVVFIMSGFPDPSDERRCVVEIEESELLVSPSQATNLPLSSGLRGNHLKAQQALDNFKTAAYRAFDIPFTCDIVFYIGRQREINKFVQSIHDLSDGCELFIVPKNSVIVKLRASISGILRPTSDVFFEVKPDSADADIAKLKLSAMKLLQYTARVDIPIAESQSYSPDASSSLLSMANPLLPLVVNSLTSDDGVEYLDANTFRNGDVVIAHISVVADVDVDSPSPNQEMLADRFDQTQLVMEEEERLQRIVEALYGSEQSDYGYYQEQPPPEYATACGIDDPAVEQGQRHQPLEQAPIWPLASPPPRAHNHVVTSAQPLQTTAKSNVPGEMAQYLYPVIPKDSDYLPEPPTRAVTMGNLDHAPITSANEPDVRELLRTLPMFAEQFLSDALSMGLQMTRSQFVRCLRANSGAEGALNYYFSIADEPAVPATPYAIPSQKEEHQVLQQQDIGMNSPHNGPSLPTVGREVFSNLLKSQQTVAKQAMEKLIHSLSTLGFNERILRQAADEGLLDPNEPGAAVDTVIAMGGVDPAATGQQLPTNLEDSDASIEAAMQAALLAQDDSVVVSCIRCGEDRKGSLFVSCGGPENHSVCIQCNLQGLSDALMGSHPSKPRCPLHVFDICNHQLTELESLVIVRMAEDRRLIGQPVRDNLLHAIGRVYQHL